MPAPMKKYAFYIKLCFALFAILFFVCAFGLSLFNIAMLLTSEQYQGTVVEEILERCKESGEHLHRAKVEFVDNTGNKRSFISRIGTADQMYFVGDQVNVLDNKSGWVNVNNFTELWSAPLVLFIAVPVFIALFCICSRFLK